MVDFKHEDTVLRTFILFVQTAHAVLKYGDAHFYRESGLSVIKFIVLQALAINGGTMTHSQIADWTLRGRNNITTLVDRLSRDGLIDTERDTRDKRYINVALTDRGWQVYRETIPVAREIVKQVMLSVTEGEAVQLDKVAGTLRQNALNGLEGIAKGSQPQPM